MLVTLSFIREWSLMGETDISTALQRQSRGDAEQGRVTVGEG